MCNVAALVASVVTILPFAHLLGPEGLALASAAYFLVGGASSAWIVRHVHDRPPGQVAGD
jgi:O-antigen/teichoic acid export membrane protein